MPRARRSRSTPSRCSRSATAASASAPTRSWSSSKASRPGVDFRYRIFNGGSGDEVEQCGNGARCFVRFVRERGLTDKKTLVVDTMNRRIELRLQDDGRVTVDMGAARLRAAARAVRHHLAGAALGRVGAAALAGRARRGPHGHRRGRVDGQPARGAARRRRRRGAGRSAGAAARAPRPLRTRRQRRLHAGRRRASGSACASSSAAPARRSPAAPARAPRSRSASASACSTARSTSRRAAAC